MGHMVFRKSSVLLRASHTSYFVHIRRLGPRANTSWSFLSIGPYKSFAIHQHSILVTYCLGRAAIILSRCHRAVHASRYRFYGLDVRNSPRVRWATDRCFGNRVR